MALEPTVGVTNLTVLREKQLPPWILLPLSTHCSLSSFPSLPLSWTKFLFHSAQSLWLWESQHPLFYMPLERIIYFVRNISYDNARENCTNAVCIKTKMRSGERRKRCSHRRTFCVWSVPPHLLYMDLDFV